MADKPDVDLERARAWLKGELLAMGTTRLESLAAEFRTVREEVWADALAPHIAAAKEREEKLWALAEEMGSFGVSWSYRLAAILGGGDDGGKA